MPPPREYEAIRDSISSSLQKKGKSPDAALKIAKTIAAKTWNKRHPDNPNPWEKEANSGAPVKPPVENPTKSADTPKLPPAPVIPKPKMAKATRFHKPTKFTKFDKGVTT